MFNSVYFHKSNYYIGVFVSSLSIKSDINHYNTLGSKITIISRTILKY